MGATKIKAEIANMLELGILTATTGKHNATLLSLTEDYDVEGDS